MTRPSPVSSKFMAAIAVCVLTGCGNSPSQPGENGEPFELRAGASVTAQGGLTIAFDRVSSDSRCPIDANCVWAGDAVVVLKVSHRSGGRDVELHTYPKGSSATVQSYTIELVALAPSTQANRPIAPGDYVATLTLSSR